LPEGLPRGGRDWFLAASCVLGRVTLRPRARVDASPEGDAVIAAAGVRGRKGLTPVESPGAVPGGSTAELSCHRSATVFLFYGFQLPR